MQVQGCQLNPVVKLSFCNETGDGPFAFSPSLAILCREVKSKGSLSRAAYEANMSYSKAWNLVKGAERNLGMKLLISQGQGGSILTEECDAILSLYETILGDLQHEAERMVG